MKRAGIAIDRWKLPIFQRHLARAGYQFTEGVFTSETLILTVDTADVEALGLVVKAANEEAARQGPPQ